MNQDLFKILKELKQIQPDLDYSKKSKNLLLLEIEANKRQIITEEILPQLKLADFFRHFYAKKFVLGMASAIVLLLIISGGVYYFKNQANENDLVAKASEANASIQVKLNEIQYLIENPNNHLDTSQIVAIQALLRRAADELKAAVSSNSQDLNKSLDKIKTVQEMLNQLNISNP